MNFGTAQNNAESFIGLMDDAFLWDGTLTPENIAQIAARGIGGFTGAQLLYPPYGPVTKLLIKLMEKI